MTAAMFVGHPHTVDTLGYRFTLLDVEPYPQHHDKTIPEADYVAYMEIAAPWDQSAINLVDDHTRIFFRYGMAPAERRLRAVEGDSLILDVSYSGGCSPHDFYLLGDCGWQASANPQMEAILVHDGHGDTCEAYLTQTLRFDLSPLRNCGGLSDSLLITFADDSISVTFAL